MLMKFLGEVGFWPKKNLLDFEVICIGSIFFTFFSILR